MKEMYIVIRYSPRADCDSDGEGVFFIIYNNLITLTSGTLRFN